MVYCLKAKRPETKRRGNEATLSKKGKSGQPRRKKTPEEKEQEIFYRKQHSNYHHVWPTSRKDLQIKKSIHAHTQWHKLFFTLTPEEAIYVIAEYWTAQDGTLKKLSEDGLKTYIDLFGAVSPQNAIKIIQEEWTLPGVTITIDWNLRKKPYDPEEIRAKKYVYMDAHKPQPPR